MRAAGLSRWSVLILLAGLLAGCGHPPYPRGSVDELFPTGQRPRFNSVRLEGRSLTVAAMAPTSTAPQAPVLLFLHGSPGSWKAWSVFLRDPQLDGFGPRLAVDRPGFGASEPGAVMTDLRAQAALLSGLIPPGRKAIVVGHSLGGPLAAWMAIDFPEKVCGALSIAGSLSSRYEAPRWYNELAQWSVVQWALPPEMVWSNREMMPLSAELALLEVQMGRLHVPLVLMQGGKDSLVDPRTVDEVTKFAPKSWLTVRQYPEASHFVLWEKPQLVIDAIRAMPCA